MYSNHSQAAAGHSRVHRLVTTALAVALIVSLATLPSATALATAGSPSSAAGSRSGPTSAIKPSATPGELLPAGELQTLLASLPLTDLSAAQLAHYLAGLEGVSGLTGLEGLLGGELGAAGLEQGLREAIEQLQLSNTPTLGSLANVEEVLPALEGTLEGTLKKLLGSLLDESQQKALEGALETVNLDKLVSTLLGSTQSGEQLATELATLSGSLFGELGTEGKLNGLLGSTLAGAFTPKTVEEVAGELKMPPAAVSEELGQTATELPKTATMLTAPLTSGKLVAVAPKLGGLALGVLGDLEGLGEGTGEGEGKGGGEGKGKETEGTGKGTGEGTGKGTGEGGSNGGSPGGSGGGQGGAGGSTGQTTILLSLPDTSSAQKASTSAKPSGRVAFLSHRVRGGVATITLWAPAAGRLTLAGRGVRAGYARAVKAQRIVLRVTLSKASIASLRRSRHHRVEVRLKATFKPASGSASSATMPITFV